MTWMARNIKHELLKVLRLHVHSCSQKPGNDKIGGRKDHSAEESPKHIATEFGRKMHEIPSQIQTTISCLDCLEHGIIELKAIVS